MKRKAAKIALFACAIIVIAMATVSGYAEQKKASTDNDIQNLTPHKALYDIKLVSAKSGAQVIDIQGQMLYEIKESCDAWTTEHKFNLSYDYTDAPPVQMISSYSTYETKNGGQLNFDSQRKRAGRVTEEYRGVARLAGEQTGEANYSKPENLGFDLPQGTLFPIAHTQEVIENAKQDKKFYNSIIFDGSDDEGPVEVNVFIGKEVNILSEMKDIPETVDANLLNGRAWKVRLAFFPYYESGSGSDYEMDAVFHDNGVVSNMLIDYDDFAVTQKLVAIESLPSPDCENRTNP